MKVTGVAWLPECWLKNSAVEEDEVRPLAVEPLMSLTQARQAVPKLPAAHMGV